MFQTTDTHTKLQEGSKVIPHLKELLTDTGRCEELIVEAPFSKGSMVADFSRHRLTNESFRDLCELADKVKLKDRVEAMFSGKKINKTENRAVLHTALRADRDAVVEVDGVNIIPDVHKVLDEVKVFADKVRSGEVLGASGKKLVNYVVIGIGGSALATEFVMEALKTDPDCSSAATGLNMRILANVDPIDTTRALDGFEPLETLAIIISKTFTTAETMMNARTVKNWLIKGLGDRSDQIYKHLVAVSTNLTATEKFGISNENVFGFWDWVGGRFSVCSAVGMLPLSLLYGNENMQNFRKGANEMDKHFRNTETKNNIALIMGLIAFYNTTYLEYPACAVLPYCQALHRFAAHIQQLCMESNGKQCKMDGTPVNYKTGEIFFGEPGTNGQHSFYQLLHQGMSMPADFIGFKRSQRPLQTDVEGVSNHDELMSNFFAQPDALALGKTPEQVKAEKVPENLIQHKTFAGNRPSTVMLLPQCDAFYCGVLLSLYEARTAVHGFLLDVNSFDQWGVELGKVLAGQIRKRLLKGEGSFVYSTEKMLKMYKK